MNDFVYFQVHLLETFVDWVVVGKLETIQRPYLSHTFQTGFKVGHVKVAARQQVECFHLVFRVFLNDSLTPRDRFRILVKVEVAVGYIVEYFALLIIGWDVEYLFKQSFGFYSFLYRYRYYVFIIFEGGNIYRSDLGVMHRNTLQKRLFQRKAAFL